MRNLPMKQRAQGATRYSTSSTFLSKHRRALGLAGVIALACGASTGWLDEPAYEEAAPAEIPSGAVKGLVLLVSFSDDQITDEQAQRIWRRLNEKGYPNGESGVTATGSLRDYFADMSTPNSSSAPLLDLTSDVIHVRLDQTKDEFDTSEADKPDVPINIFDLEGTLAKITMPGPATELLHAATCRLTGCDEVAISYDVVTASSVTAHSTPYSFKDLTTRTFSFWPDANLRENFGQRDMRRGFDVPKIETFAYLGLVYAGSASNGAGEGLWPRSVATPGTRIAGADVSTRAARFFITGTYGTDSTPLALLAHESAHTLFDFPDLYDGGEEVGLSTSDTVSSGIGAHALLGSPNPGEVVGVWERPQNMSAPLRDRLGWANIIDLNNLAEGTEVQLAANGVDVARYCRDDSPTNECFYIEARHNDSPRSARGCSEGDCTLVSPAEGLMIWHAENLKNAMDYVVNNHEVSTPNTHNQVLLVEAGGTNELLQARGAAINYADHYFRSGAVERFDYSTPASSRWWDGTPSGLNIKNISNPGSTMSFELGQRPMSRVFTDTDAHVQVQVGASELPIGETTQVTTIGDASWQYDVHILEGTGVDSLGTQSYIGLSGQQSFSLRGVEGDAHVEIVSYPTAGSSRAASARFHTFMAEGSRVTTYAADALEFSGMGRLVQQQNRFVTLLPGRDVGWTPDREADVTVHVPEAGGQALWVAKAAPGYMLTSIEAYQVGDSERQTVTSPGTGELTLSVDVSSAAEGNDSDYIIEVNAEAIPGFTCAAGQVEGWRVDKVLNDVGDLVRHDDVIYSSNIPRNLLWSNFGNAPTASDPQTATEYWTPVAVCGEYQATCGGLPEWKLEGNALPSDFTGDVVFNGARYSFVGSDVNEVPGGFESKQIRSGADMFAEVDPDYSLESNRLFVYHDSASWRLQGHCNDAAVAGRATVVTNGGIASVSSPTGAKSVRANEPVVVNDTTGSFSLSFTLRAGFALDEVLVDGQTQSVSSSATSVTVLAANGNRPRVIELRTRPL